MVKQIEQTSDIPEKGTVVIDFFATWCGPCKQIAPLFQQLESAFPSITFLKVDVDQANELAEIFDVRAMPTFVFLKDGKRLADIEGADLHSLRRMLESLV